MAFANNQQDAFNLRNDTESLKQWQSELDKATTSIGAAEVAAEEELAALKFKNLTALQEARVAKLEQLIALEDKGIRELAKARLTLSDRQFALRKKEIQKEFQLAKNAAEELFKIKNKKAQTSAKKSTSATKDITTTSKAKYTNTTADKKDSGRTTHTSSIKKVNDIKSASPEFMGLLSSIDETLISLRDAVASYIPSKEESPPILPIAPIKPTEPTEATVQQTIPPKNQEATSESLASINVGEDLLDILKAGVEALVTTTEQRLTSIKAQYEARDTSSTVVEDVKEILAKPIGVDKPAKPITIDIKGTEQPSSAPAELTSAIETVAEIFQGQKPPETNYTKLDEAKLGEELLDVLKTGIEALLSTTEQRLANLKIVQETDTKAPSVAESLKDALTKTNNSKEPKSGSEQEPPTDNTFIPPNKTGEAEHKPSEEKKLPEKKEFSNDAALLDLIDLGHYSFEAVSSSFEALKDSMDTGVKNVLNQAITKDEDGKSTVSQGTTDLAGDLLVSIKKAEAAEEKRRELIADKDADEATKRAVALNKQIISETELQKLREQHTTKANNLTLAAIANEAKANDLKNNKEAYALEARLARENAFYEERNRLEENRIKAEEEIAWNADHRKELLEQEEQRVRLEYLAEYQKLQTDGANHLTENMTAEAFIALKKQTKAAEDSIARREKASTASKKALDILRGKGTKDEKKALLDAQVKLRAAEKDWTGTKFEIKPDDSEAEQERKRKAQENAVKAEMAINAAMSALANLAQKLNNQTDKIGEKQALIDTRLQGSTVNDTMVGSYWKRLAKDMNYIGAVNPYFKQEDFANNIETLVNKGISFDIKQRAFLMTIQEKIANTFDAADGTLLRLIRIQQQDTTAGRLGMESALNSFLNSMYETSEYLTDVASSVRSSLGELQALMEGAAGTELEFQVQKWMGSLYSVGMSQDAVQSIAQTFGQIVSGDVGGLTGNGTGNLLIMAANEAGISIADILQEGLDADETNKLMQAMVNYLAEIAEMSSDSRVVQQQLANVYGIKASDLRAATNLASSIKDVSKQDLTYSGMLGQLNKMANSMLLRTSTGEMLSNIWGNTQYTMATTMANDPLLYLLPRVATLLEDYAGGIDLPFVNAMGFGVDLNTSVAQLMNVAAMSGTILGSLGPMVSGLASAVSGDVMLGLAGINTKEKAPVIARGSAQTLQHLGGFSLTESGFIGNASGDDIKKQTLIDADDEKKKLLVEAKDEEAADDVTTQANLAVVNIYNLLEEVAHGSQSLRVRVVNNGNILSAGGSIASGQNTTIGENSNDGTTSFGAGKNGTDNGNWVLSF